MSLNKPNKAIGPQVRQKHNEKTNKQLVILVALAFHQYAGWHTICGL